MPFPAHAVPQLDAVAPAPRVPSTPVFAAARQEGRALAAVVAVGGVVAALTWRAPEAGLGWLATDAVLVLAVVFGLSRGKPGTAGAVLAFVSLWLAAVTAWRASDWALAVAMPGSLLALVALALASARRLEAGRAGGLGVASLDALRAIPAGLVDAGKMPARAVSLGARHHAASVAKGAFLGAPIACVFAALLSADHGFRAALRGLVDGAGDAFELALYTLGVTGGLLAAFAVLRRLRAGGSPVARAPIFAPVPYRAEGDAPAPELSSAAAAPALRVSPVTWAVVLGQVTLVFGVYVFANLGALFAGHDYLRAAGTETYAAYVHTGFLQVSFATLLAVACVFGGHLVLTPRAGARRIAGGKGLVAIELALLAVVALSLASCVHRLGLYGEAYGYTYLRLAVRVFQIAVGGLLALTAARCLARAASGFGSALTWSFVATVAVAGSIDADGWIARQNVARARAGAPLDAGYLATLSEDARGILPEVAALDTDAASFLAERWDDARAEHASRGWRARRGLGAR